LVPREGVRKLFRVKKKKSKKRKFKKKILIIESLENIKKLINFSKKIDIIFFILLYIIYIAIFLIKKSDHIMAT